jgi:hypothetical protein
MWSAGAPWRTVNGAQWRCDKQFIVDGSVLQISVRPEGLLQWWMAGGALWSVVQGSRCYETAITGSLIIAVFLS